MNSAKSCTVVQGSTDIKCKSVMTYMIREYTRDIKGMPGHKGCKNYYVYCSSDEFEDYYTAILYAIDIEKKTGIKNWVDCINVEWPTEPKVEFDYI